MNAAEAVAGVIRGRRSIRRFGDEPVERATIERLVELAGWAPSAGNRQDWCFTVVTSPTVKREMAGVVRERWNAIVAENRGSGFIEEVKGYVTRFADFESAPVVVVVSARTPDAVQLHMLGEAAGATTGSSASAAMAAQNMMLAAHALGLGSCCMTGALAAREEISGILGFGKKEEIVCLVTLGWPSEAPQPPPRKPVEKTAKFVE